jgi:hypothetical protein
MRLPSSVALLLLVASLAAQQSSSPRPPAAKPLRDASRLVPPLEETGFQAIFDGKSLHGWDGDPRIWRVENGALVGETTPDKPIQHNTFLIWRGGSPADFELKLEYRLTGGNSGIQYRSVEVPGIRWALKGYQADIDAQQTWTGQLYEERGRGFLALRGQISYLPQGGKPGAFGTLGEPSELRSLIKDNDWNSFHVIARHNVLMHLLNGRLMSLLIDDDTANRKMEGLIGFQVHMGPPMKIELRNIRLKLH